MWIWKASKPASLFMGHPVYILYFVENILNLCKLIYTHFNQIICSSAQIPTLQAFHTPMGSVRLDALGSAEVEVDFLPFHVGERQCSVIFLNENIGEFLYSIEAKALEPLPSYLPYVPSKSSVRISSAAAAGNCYCHIDLTMMILYLWLINQI